MGVYWVRGRCRGTPNRFLTGRLMYTTTLHPPAQWAQLEFGLASLGDRRRTQRLVNIATHLAASPGGTLPQAFPHWAELKAAYRFLANAAWVLNAFSPRIWRAPARRAESRASI